MSFFYSLSLSLVPRLFIAGMSASILHIFLRNLFSLAGLIFFTSNARQFRPVVIGQCVLIVVMTGIAVVSPDQVIQAYYWEYFYFSFSAAFVSFRFFFSEVHSKADSLLRQIVFAWAIVQTLDMVTLWILPSAGLATAPAMILFLNVSAFRLRVLNRRSIERVSSAVREVLSIAKAELKINDIIREIALVLRQESF